MKPAPVASQKRHEPVLPGSPEDLNLQLAVAALSVGPRFERTLAVVQPHRARVEAEPQAARAQPIPELHVFAAVERRIEASHGKNVLTRHRGVARPELAEGRL